MARARNIKPGILKNELLGTADPLLTILFAGLWMLADREGRLEDRPLRIRAEVFPYRDGVDVDGLLDWLAANDFIDRYEAEGQKCLAIHKFVDHQRPHQNEPPSVLPANKRSKPRKPKGASPSTNGKSTSLLLIESLLTESPSPLGTPSGEFRAALERWAQHRTERRCPLTDKSLRQQAKQMAVWGEARSIAAIDHSIAGGYQGLFEAKGSGRAGGRPDAAATIARQAHEAMHAGGGS